MSKEFYDDGQYGHFADIVDVSEAPTQSELLDAKGNPMRYEQRTVGFDLTPKGEPQ